MDKITGRSVYHVPNEKLQMLAPYASSLTKKQLNDLQMAMQTGSGMQITPSRTQSGGFLGTLLASIGIPMVMNALTGRGMQVMPSGSGMQVMPRGLGMQMKGTGTTLASKRRSTGKPLFKKPPQKRPYRNPGYPNKKKGSGLLLGPNSPFNSIPLVGSIL